MCRHCEAKERGRSARLSGIGVSECPYSIGSTLALDWVSGWVSEDTEFVEAARALELQSIREGRIVR